MVPNLYLVGTVVLVIYLCKRITRYIQVRRITQEHGCKPVNKLHQSERILGYGFLKIQMQAVKEKRILEISRGRYQLYGNSWSGYMLGQNFVNVSLS